MKKIPQIYFRGVKISGDDVNIEVRIKEIRLGNPTSGQVEVKGSSLHAEMA